MYKKILNLIKNPIRILFILCGRGFINLNWLSDEKFIKMEYAAYTGKKLNLSSPKTFNEKIQWLKLYGKLENYTHLVDKYEVRKYISATIGEKYLIPLIGVWNKFDDIDFNKLPEQFVLKCTHDFNSIIICKDKTTFNKRKARNKLEKCLKRNFYYSGRETQYKNIKPKIIAEKYMVDESGIELKDYKIFCFNGIPRVIQVDFDRFVDHKRLIFDTEWNYIPVAIAYPTNHEWIINKPENLGEMLHLAEILSKNYPHVRVDLYSIAGRIYFGELTFTHEAGFAKFEPEEFAYKMGSWIELPSADILIKND